MGSPSALMQWLNEGGTETLGREANRWISLIFYASWMIREAVNAAERKAFRDVALAAADAGRRMGALPASMYLERVIYIRMSYLRTSDEDPAWQYQEMGHVLNIFLDSLPMDLVSARAKSQAWRGQPIQVIKSLRNIKNLLRLMEPGSAYLGDDQRETLEEWLRIRPELP